jgi:enoyl-CoA hydratase/carnithine racemase
VAGAAAVRYDVRDRIATITLDRPDRGNALTLQLCAGVVDALDAADRDDDVSVVILTGAGRHFCVGADLGEGFHHGGREPSPRHAEFVRRFGTVDGVPRDVGGVVTMRMAAMLKPVIAAVNGTAVGGGATMVLPADIRIIADGARVGFVFGRRGMAAESASSWFLPRIVGISRAAEWVLTGRLVDAGEALEGGLVSRVVAADALLSVAHDLAREIADNTSTVGTSISRQLLWSMLSAASPWDAHAMESAAVYGLPSGADVVEGVQAFLDKRAAEFPLRVPRDYPDYAPRWPGDNPRP